MQNDKKTRMHLASFGLLAAAILTWNGSARAGGLGEEIRYTGRATVIDASAKLLTSTTKFVQADTGELDFSGALREDTVLSFSNPAPLAVQAKALTALTAGENDTSASMAAVTKISVKLPGLNVTADTLESNASATCRRDSMTVKTEGSSTVANLRINNMPINYTGKPNQTINIPGVATVIINEQYNPDVNTKAVNALHIKVPGAPGVASADVIVSHARAGIFTCPCD